MRAIVCGGRDFDDVDLAYATLDRLRPSVVISGGARGADSIGEMWAHERGVHVERFPADWYKHGRSAGPIRNEQMLKEGKPDMVIAFPGGRGTAHMVKIAREAGVPVEVVRP